MSKVTENLIRRRLWKENHAYGEGCYTTSKGKIRDLVAARLLSAGYVPCPLTEKYLIATDFDIVKDNDGNLKCWVHKCEVAGHQKKYVIYNSE
tara:strand:+ start:312 stop:590 length:279 start_codon:yes stop_codon:yes gene_type:complete